jgi:hypothetical protein
MDMLARVYRLDSFATVRRESSSVYNCTDMLKILHGFIDLIDSSASMDSPKSSPVYKCSNKQKELLWIFAGVIDLLHGAKKMPESINPIKSQ